MKAGEPGEADEDAASDEPVRAWWERSAPLAACASLAIGAGTLWFGNMLSRVPLDAHSTFAYLLMLPLLLIVPAFSLAALKLSWVALRNRKTAARPIVMLVALSAAVLNLLAMERFGGALWRIFSN